MFNALHLVDLVMIGLVLRLPKFVVYYGFSPCFILVISVLAKRLAAKSVSDMTYIVSSGTLNLNSIILPSNILLLVLLMVAGAVLTTLCLFVFLFVYEHDNSLSYGWIFL